MVGGGWFFFEKQKIVSSYTPHAPREYYLKIPNITSRTILQHNITKEKRGARLIDLYPYIYIIS